MNAIWQINNWKALLLSYQLGFRNGKKIGDRPTAKEFFEVQKRHPDWIEYCGATELNSDELVREYASHGNKILHIKPLDKDK